MEKKTIGTFVAALRKANGLTQKQLSDMLNVSDKAVSRWERDECAPDLSVIPVLAEIFNVTADEILQGQRTNPDPEPRPADADKSQRQKAYLLRSTQTRFRIRCFLCASMPLFGVILACILNLELSAPNGGFLACLVLSLFATVLQITAFISSVSALGDDENEDQSFIKCKQSMLYWMETVLSGSLIALALTAPLAGSREPVPFLTCLTDGCKFALGAAVLCAVVCLILDIVHVRRYKCIGTSRALLCRTITALLMISVLIGHISLNTFLLNNRHLYTDCKTHTDLHSFEALITEPRSPEGYLVHYANEYYGRENNNDIYLYISENLYTEETTLYTPEKIIKTLTEPTNPDLSSTNRFTPEFGYEFLHFNRQIAYYEISGDKDIVPIYTFTQEQFSQSEETAAAYSLLYTLAYTLPIGIGYILNALLRKKQQ